jgi:hypothetical protein
MLRIFVSREVGPENMKVMQYETIPYSCIYNSREKILSEPEPEPEHESGVSRKNLTSRSRSRNLSLNYSWDRKYGQAGAGSGAGRKRGRLRNMYSRFTKFFDQFKVESKYT